MTQESGPRMNASSAKQSWGPKRWSVNKGNDPRNSIGVDMYCREIRLGEVLKISYEKAAASALNALQLTLWSHKCGSDAWTMDFSFTATT